MKIKHLIGLAGATVFALAWAAVGVGVLTGVDRATWTVLFVVAAFATEGLVWCIAVMLGLSAFEARRRIWRWVSRPFRKRA